MAEVRIGGDGMSGRRYRITWPLLRDRVRISKIERECFGDGAMKVRDIDLDLSACSPKYSRIARLDGLAIAWMLYSATSSAYRIERLAVLPEAQRSGVGGSMVRYLLHRLSINQSRKTYRPRVEVITDDSNLSSHLFFKSLGFRAAGVIRGFGDAGDEYLFSYRSSELRDVSSDVREDSGRFVKGVV